MVYTRPVVRQHGCDFTASPTSLCRDRPVRLRLIPLYTRFVAIEDYSKRMATTDKVKKSQPVSAKQSAKERRAMQEKRRQRQQQILLGIVAGALLLGVLLIVFLQTRPVEASIPAE